MKRQGGKSARRERREGEEKGSSGDGEGDMKRGPSVQVGMGS